jgi:hypothetical protein
MSNKNVIYDEDYETWNAYKHDESKRWVFNKLEVALRQGLNAGPAGTAPDSPGDYVVRPVYNIYGMGISASKVTYNDDQFEQYINHNGVKPGHFWCEWLEGPHRSVDYVFKDGRWVISSVLIGNHYNENNLTKFHYWTKVPTQLGTPIGRLPLVLPLDDLTALNIEFRSQNIIEVHFRLGNDPFDDLPVGSVITPIWNDDEPISGQEFRANLHEDMELYSASGNLSDVRRGYSILRPPSQ